MCGDDRPAISFDGVNYLVAWEHWQSGSCYDIYAARVTPGGAVLDTAGVPISVGGYGQRSPAVAFDGTDFRVTWEDHGDGSGDIYGARVTPAGTVLDVGPVVRQPGSQSHPCLCRGRGSDILLVYQGWAGTVDGRTYKTQRVWGKPNPDPGVAEKPNREVRTSSRQPTFARDVLRIAQHSSCELLDASGRCVLKLRPGPNDVSRLATGVYFVQLRLKQQAQTIHKVILTR